MTKYELGNILIYEQPTKYIVKSENYDDAFATPVLTPGQTFILGYTNETDGIYSAPLPVIIFDDFTTATKLVNFPFKVKSSAMKILKPASDKVYIPYWYYYLSSLKVDNGLHKRYWISTFANRQISAPSFPEQKRIATLLDKVQELIAKQKEQIAKLDLLIKSRFLDMFGDPISNPKKWPCQSLSNVAPKQSRKVAAVSSVVWLLNLDQIEANNGRVIKKERLDSSELGNSILPFYSGEVLYSKLRPYLNKVVLADEDGFCTTELLPLHPQKEICNALFLAHLLRQQSVVVVLSIRVVGAKMPRVDLTTLRSLLIPLPPLSLQSQFANFVKSVEQQKEVFSARLSHLEILYKSLMQEYFG